MTTGSEATQQDGERSSVVSIRVSPMLSKSIEFNREKTKLLHKAYDKALRSNQVSFKFEGEELLTPYAGYLLEYLNSRLI